MARSDRKRKKKQFNWRIWVASLLFLIAGLLLASGPIRTFLLAQYQQEQTQIASKVSAAEVKANEEAEAEFDFSKVDPIDLQQVFKAKTESQKFLTLGMIAVPSVNLNLPIYKGVSNPVLLAGAGTMKPDQKMGEGNYALASHNYFGDKTILFSPLVDAQVGDKVYLTDMENIYEYEMTSIDIIKPTQVEVINDEPGVTEVTLITCDDWKASNRYCLKAKLVSKTSVSSASEDMKKVFDVDFTTLK